MKLLLRDGGVDRFAQLGRAGGAGDVGGSPGLQRGARQVALGQLAVGDDAERGAGAVQHPDRLGAADGVALAVAAPAHVDDRDVEVADVADQVEPLLAGL